MGDKEKNDIEEKVDTDTTSNFAAKSGQFDDADERSLQPTGFGKGFGRNEGRGGRSSGRGGRDGGRGRGGRGGIELNLKVLSYLSLFSFLFSSCLHIASSCTSLFVSLG